MSDAKDVPQEAKYAQAQHEQLSDADHLDREFYLGVESPVEIRHRSNLPREPLRGNHGLNVRDNAEHKVPDEFPAHNALQSFGLGL